ncbi:MAG: M20/M25/M40 family metallo-hydrolase, partial [Bryobacteraceae bacterium]
MDPILSYTRSKQKEIIAFLGALVECESPSGDAQAIENFARIIEDRVRPFARTRRIRGGTSGPHLQCEFDLPGPVKKGRLLALGHSDTVYPSGTLPRMPFRQSKGRLWGPGVLDMKGGIAFFIFAMEALRDLKIPVARNVILQLNSDEEVGSHSSRSLTEKEARRSVAVLVLEPGTGLEGRPKTARKGVGDYTLAVHGRAAHAGIDFMAGASAILELSRQIASIAGFTRLDRGITVNPG